MIDTKRIHKIKSDIKETSDVGVGVFKREFEKFDSHISGLIAELNEEVVTVNKDIAIAITDLNRAKKELKDILYIVEANKGKLKELDEKEIGLKEKEENLLDLHKVLTNRQKMLDAKESILQTKERRVDG